MSEPLCVAVVGTVRIWTIDGAVYFQAGMQIDCDGAPNAYHPPTNEHPQSGRPPGLDDLRNAGHAGNWWGIATDTGKADGNPVIQKRRSDPYPGFYVSPTALSSSGDHRETSSYVDSTRFAYFVLPSGLSVGMHLGDLGICVYGDIVSAGAIYADVGPKGKIGEGSIALLESLGLFTSVGNGHDFPDIDYILFPASQSTPAWPRGKDDIDGSAQTLFGKWGGLERLEEVRAETAE